MALNQPDCYEEDLDLIISDNLDNLITELHKVGFEVKINDLEYELLSRVEYIGIQSEKLYPNEDLPRMFGVQRGYSGGGVHSGLIQTEIDHLPKNRIAKAERALDLFEKTFWQIFKDLDGLSETNTGEPVETWNSVGL